ncbi:MAG: DUF2550 domain-containing protein [Actinomycetales bacterium]
MHDLLIPLEVVVAVLAVTALCLVAVVSRRRFLTRGVGAFDCSLRFGSTSHGMGWRLGVARYEADRIDWYRMFSFSPRVGTSLVRADLLVQERRRPAGPESFAILAGALIVRCRYRDEVVELAMSEQAYTGFAAWLESAPPGQNVNVA